MRMQNTPTAELSENVQHRVSNTKCVSKPLITFENWNSVKYCLFKRLEEVEIMHVSHFEMSQFASMPVFFIVSLDLMSASFHF